MAKSKLKSTVSPRLLSGPVGFHGRNATIIGLVLSTVALIGVISTFAASGTRHGSLTVTAYEKVGTDLKAKRLPGVGIHLNRACETAPRTDDVTNSAGNAQFTECPVDSDSNHRVYNVSVSSVPAGYHMADSKDKDVNVRWVGLIATDPITNAFFILEKDAPGSSGSSLPTTSGSQPTQQQQTSSQPSQPRDQDVGSIKIISYDYNGGSIKKVGGVAATVQGLGFGINDAAHNCNPHSVNTGSDAEATFPNCYSGLEGLKRYKLASVVPPAGYTYRRLYGAEVEDGDVIKVLAGRQSTVQIWLNKVAPVASGGGGPSTNRPSASGGGGTAGSGSNSSSATSNNTSPAAGTQESASDLADVDTTDDGFDPGFFDDLDGLGLLDLEDDGDSYTPPSPVSHLGATTDNSGAVHLQWHSGDNNFGFIVERSTDSTNWTTLSQDGSETTYDDSHTSFDTTYYYRVTGIGSADDLSSAVTIQLKTPVFNANVLGSSTQPTAVSSSDGSATATLPANQNTDYACSLPHGNKGHDGLGSDLTATSETYQLVCKDKLGDIEDSLDFDLELDVDVSDLEDISATDDLSGFSDDNKLYQYDGNDWNEVKQETKPQLKKTTKNGKTVILAAYKYSAKNTSPIAVLGVKIDKTKTLATIGVTALLTGLALAAVVIFRQTRRIPQLTPAIINSSPVPDPASGTTVQPPATPAAKPRAAADYVKEALDKEGQP
ncbi:MAG TPA: fibronectin type III domain-containing protein [Candidatus Saccharimonadales bacterium]|nr:fibronectin type III domain-containing protein [Candidatus Saccharimonadales bacterium]